MRSSSVPLCCSVLDIRSTFASPSIKLLILLDSASVTRDEVSFLHDRSLLSVLVKVSFSSLHPLLPTSLLMMQSFLNMWERAAAFPPRENKTDKCLSYLSVSVCQSMCSLLSLALSFSFLELSFLWFFGFISSLSFCLSLDF